MAAELPGFFPVQEEPPAIDDPHAANFLSWNADSDLDVRFSWPVLSDGTPDAYTLIQYGAVGVVNGDDDAGGGRGGSARRRRRVVRARTRVRGLTLSVTTRPGTRGSRWWLFLAPGARRSTSGSWRSRC